MNNFSIITNLESVNDFIIDNQFIPINGDIVVLKKYYNVYQIDNCKVVTEYDDYDFIGYNYLEFLSQKNIDFLKYYFEINTENFIRRYILENVSHFNNIFNSFNTPISQELYFKSFIAGLNSVLDDFKKMISSKNSLEFDEEKLNDFQISALEIILPANISILNSVEEKYSPYYVNLIDYLSIFGQNLESVKKVYDGLAKYSFIDSDFEKKDFIKILDVNYLGNKKINFNCAGGNEFFYFLNILLKATDGIIKNSLLYNGISKRFSVLTKKLPNGIKLNSETISKGLSSTIDDDKVNKKETTDNSSYRTPNNDSNIYKFKEFLL